MPNTEPKVAFDHLHQSLAEYQRLFFDGSLKATGFFLLVMGWILTSDKAGTFMTTHQSVATVGGWSLIICAIAYVMLSVRLLSIMRGLGRELDAIDFLPRSYYEHRLVHPVAAAMWMILAITPCVTLAFYLTYGFGTTSS